MMSRRRTPRKFEVIVGQPWTINGEPTEATTPDAALTAIYDQAELFPITIAVRGDSEALILEMDEYGTTRAAETPEDEEPPEDLAEDLLDEDKAENGVHQDVDQEPEQEADQQAEGAAEESESEGQEPEEDRTRTTHTGQPDLSSTQDTSEEAAPITEGGQAMTQSTAARTEPAETKQDEAAGTPPISFAESFATRKGARRTAELPAEEGWRGAVNRAFWMKLRPGPHEATMRRLHTAIQQGLAGSRTVMFCNVKGGSRKTTSTFNTAAAIGRIRGGNILAWDNNENSGDLVDRGQRAAHGRTAIDLHEQLDQLATLDKVDQLTNYAHPQGNDRFEVLASQDVAGTRQVIDAEAFRDMHEILRTFYSMILVDTGNASTATTWQATAEAADVVVVTMENADNSASKAAQTLDAIRSHSGSEKVENAVAVIYQPMEPSTKSKERNAELHQLLEPQVRSVLEVPFDPALKEGEEIVWEALHKKTREAYVHVAAAVVNGMSH